MVVDSIYRPSLQLKISNMVMVTCRERNEMFVTTLTFTRTLLSSFPNILRLDIWSQMCRAYRPQVETQLCQTFKKAISFILLHNNITKVSLTANKYTSLIWFDIESIIIFEALCFLNAIFQYIGTWCSIHVTLPVSFSFCTHKCLLLSTYPNPTVAVHTWVWCGPWLVHGFATCAEPWGWLITATTVTRHCSMWSRPLHLVHSLTYI